MMQPDISSMQPEPEPETPVKDMMYGGAGNGLPPNTFRVERGFPYTRRGIIQPPIPQFKGLYLYSQAAGHVPPVFRQTMTSTRVKWPVPPGKQVPTGS